MSEKKQQVFTNTLSVDSYRSTYYKGVSNFFSEEIHPDYKRDQYVISYLSTKSFISTLIGISKNIPDSDIADIIENKVYEDLALDMAISYDIRYIPASNTIDENDRFFHVFVADTLAYKEDFTSAIAKIKYIDNIIPVALLFKALYSKEIIDDNGVHCFIYFQKDETFLTIYSEEEFVYTKALKYSLIEIHKRFCELIGEQIAYETFQDILEHDGLASLKKEYQQHFIKLFSEVFLHVSDILTYTKRAFNISSIDHIYIGSEFKNFAGLDEYAQTYLAIKSTELNFNYCQHNSPVNQLHALMQLYTSTPEDERYECNFTLFKRPPPFAKRESGKLILLTLAALFLGLIYPIIYWSLAYGEALHCTLLQNTYNEVHQNKLTRELEINAKKKQKSEINALEKAQKDEYDNKKNTLEKIHDVKVNYPMKSQHLTEFTKDLNQ